jgi:hypothetical protein
MKFFDNLYFRGERPRKRLVIFLLCALCIPALAHSAYAQAAPDNSQAVPEPGIAQKIAQLKTAKRGLARQANEAQGYHESLRRMKIVKINQLISRLKQGDDVPQSEIDHTINHMSFPLYQAP